MNKNDEIFHEIYGAYYNAVWHILNKISGEYTKISQKTINDIVFEYSNKLITSGAWADTEKHVKGIMTGFDVAYGSDISFKAPEMPLSLMQKRWLKAVLADRRIKLFGIEEPEWLSGIEPLFSMEDFVYFDQDLEGDNYSDENYISHFKTILEALNNGFKLNIIYGGKNSNYENANAIPLKLEYSPRNDKFRLFIKNEKEKYFVLNLSKIQEVKLSDKKFEAETAKLPKKEEYIKQLVLILDNSAGKHDFSRAMREFSDLKKETEPLGNLKYKITMEYYKDDEEEIVIRLMPYLPYIEVKKPFEVKKKIQEKLRKQLSFGELK